MSTNTRLHQVTQAIDSGYVAPAGPMLEAFDQPDTLTSCARRGVSTFAPQALILLNGPLAP